MYFAKADLQKCLLLERKLDGLLYKLVKLHLPPPEILIFSAIFEECSIKQTLLPLLPASIEHINPAAPAPITITSYELFI